MNSLKRMEPPYIFNNVDNRVILSKKKGKFQKNGATILLAGVLDQPCGQSGQTAAS